MKFTRLYSDGRPPYDQVEWRTVTAEIPGSGFRQEGVEVPAAWSDTAANILAQKYLRRAGVPDCTRPAYETSQLPTWLIPSVPAEGHILGGEASAHQVFHRLAGCWTYWGWRSGVFQTNKGMENQTWEQNARIFYDECYLMLARQIGAPNSPQWFNTGLNWAYGITGDPVGTWVVDPDTGIAYPAQDKYSNPQPHACFIQPVKDDLVGPGGIMDLWVREARLFKFGSGSGTNYSTLRGKNEKLSGGGTASGVMSFLRIGDRAAGAIQSGGTTRRAAKMVVLDVDHPEIEEFVDWKVREEGKAAALAYGSKELRDRHTDPIKSRSLSNVIPDQIYDRASIGMAPKVYDLGWESEAIDTVSGQNSNNSVRVPDAFLKAVDDDGDWALTARSTGETVNIVRARGLWDRICRAAWASADPGVQFHDTTNAWHTCAADGPIRASNPCSEYLFLDNTACNLASLNQASFLRPDGSLDLIAYRHAVRIWTVVLDISIGMASFPSKEIAEASHAYRTLGLGYANLGGLLMHQAIPYDSDKGRALAAGMTALMTGTAYVTSAEMASELGSFPRWEANKNDMERVMSCHKNALTGLVIGDGGLNVAPPCYGPNISVYYQDLYQAVKSEWNQVCRSKYGFRNAQVTLLAPTGTISFVMDCDTTGIEPFYSRRSVKNLAGGGVMDLVHDVMDEDCAVPSSPGGPCLTPEAHVKMVAAVQPFLSGGVSKTVNMPRTATPADVDRNYRLAHRLGLKSVAIYRDGSKLSQPLSSVSTALTNDDGDGFPLERASPPVPVGEARGIREYLPWRRSGVTQKLRVDGQTVYLRTGEYPDGRLGEIFVNLSKEGSTTRALVECWAKAISIGLQYGVPLEEFADAFLHTRFEPAGPVQGHDRVKMCSSLVDLIWRDLAVAYLGRDNVAHLPAPTGNGQSVPEPSQGHLGTSPVGGNGLARPVIAPAPNPHPSASLAVATGPYTAPIMEAYAVAKRQLTTLAVASELVNTLDPADRECWDCHAMALTRTGTCVTCEACGAHSGCG